MIVDRSQHPAGQSMSPDAEAAHGIRHSSRREKAPARHRASGSSSPALPSRRSQGALCNRKEGVVRSVASTRLRAGTSAGRRRRSVSGRIGHHGDTPARRPRLDAGDADVEAAIRTT